MDPLTMALIGMGVANIAAQAIGSSRQNKYQERVIDEQKKTQRRQAIERALGGTFWQYRPEPPKPPNLTGEGIVQGITQLGMTMAPQMMGQPKPVQPVQPAYTGYGVPPAQRYN